VIHPGFAFELQDVINHFFPIGGGNADAFVGASIVNEQFAIHDNVARGKNNSVRIKPVPFVFRFG